MRNMHKVLLLLFMVAGCLAAPESHCQKNEKGLLWKISGGDLEAPSYLYGTIHVIDSIHYSLHNTIVEKMAKCEQIVFEVDVNDPEFQKKSIAQSFMKTDSLSGILSPELYQRADSLCKEKLNVGLKVLNRIKPLYVSEIIGSTSLPKAIVNYEEELKRIANEKNIPINGISTVDNEAEIIRQIPMESQIMMLADAIENYDKNESRRQKIVKLYQKQDIGQIYSVMHKEVSQYPSVFAAMFPLRHEVWLPKMADMMSSGACFFAVGVGHLAGEQGLINQLREAGYRVKPVKMDFKVWEL